MNIGMRKAIRGNLSKLSDNATPAVNAIAKDRAFRRALSHALNVLPGTPAPDGQIDPRWQAIIDLGKFVESHPEPLWDFCLQWGKHPSADLRAAIATCLLEHLLECHFDLLFPRLRKAALQSSRFTDTFSRCWWLGEARLEHNLRRLERLRSQLRNR